MAASCSSGVLFGVRESGSNGAFLGQFDGLRQVEKIHMPTKSHGFVSTSGNYIQSISLVISI